MENVAGFNMAISAILDVPTEDASHPFVTVAKFVFADDRPNANRQAVDYAEFANIKRTAIGMPVKMKFIHSDEETGGDIGDHEGSIPIGVIRSIEETTGADGSHQLVAEALLWKEEYPEEVDFLKASFAEGEKTGDVPGVSYELGYADSETRSGIQFIKRVVTLAATFVKNPAYGKRTRLLALAATASIEQIVADIKAIAESTGIPIESIIDALEDLAEEEPPMDPLMMGNSSIEGGNQMEEELQQERAKAASLASEIEALRATIAEKDSALTKAQEEISGLKFAALIDTRTRQVVEAGLTLEADAEKAEKKKALWASLSEEQFAEYLEDLVNAKKAATPAPLSPAQAAIALASASSAMPRLDSEVDESIAALKSAMRGLARPNSTE